MQYRPPEPPPPPPVWLLALRKWLFTGNLVAKFGLLILFIGVSFLLKYTAERVTVPLELRLAGVVLADIGLLLWGWRIRQSRRGIALPVQGAALAIMMLITFGAFQRYHLIPAAIAFPVLFGLTVFTCLLAVLQNAVWLAAFGIAGGFASPILSATGSGSHIALFSYYCLLNVGILAIALRKSWRALNLLGFAFTFVVGGMWGELRYDAAHYLSTQAFLVLFFLFYVGIALAYAAREAPRLNGYVDGTLVFGTPVIAFGLQYGLVKDVPFGLAFSALALGMFYVGLAVLLWRRGGASRRVLVEAFMALGVVFATLALPLAFDGRWTSAAWALEGAGIVWVGLRQKQPRTWGFGLLVQAGAWISFLASVQDMNTHSAAQSNLWLGFLLLAVSAFGMATSFRAQSNADGGRRFGYAGNAFLVFATTWLLAGAWTEILLKIDGPQSGDLLVASSLVVAIGLGLLAGRMGWSTARSLTIVVQGAAGVAFALVMMKMKFNDFAASGSWQLLLGSAMMSAGAIFSSRAFGRRLADANGTAIARNLLVWAGLWWFLPALLAAADCSVDLLHQVFPKDGNHTSTLMGVMEFYAIFVAASALAAARAAIWTAWPDLRWFSATCWAQLLLSSYLMLNTLYSRYDIPSAGHWAAYLTVWLSADYLLRWWPSRGWPISDFQLKLLHLVRSGTPWLMIWPVGSTLIGNWLAGPMPHQELLERTAWQISGSWAHYVPTWIMMLGVFWLIRRSVAERWPASPIAPWYRQFLIPGAACWFLLLALVWNLQQNGAMAPLPYLPLLNPLDLTTGFAALLGVAGYRMLKRDTLDPVSGWPKVLELLPLAAVYAGYAWFNLILLRTAAHYLGIDYRIDDLMASRFVQAMLSITWSVTALIVMRRACATRPAASRSKEQWTVGAVLLGVVVAKLFLADLANTGSVERIVSFVGVGLLMVAIGYLAPFPSTRSRADAAPVASHDPDPIHG